MINACVNVEGYIRGPFQVKEETRTTIAKGFYSEEKFSHNELMMVASTLRQLTHNIQELLDAHNKKFSFNVDPEKFKNELKKRTFIP